MRDLIIRNGTIVDGTGGAPFVGDVAIDGERIVEVGTKVSGMFMKSGEAFAHGLNEKAPLATLDGSLMHWDMILRDLAK